MSCCLLFGFADLVLLLDVESENWLATLVKLPPSAVTTMYVVYGLTGSHEKTTRYYHFSALGSAF